MVNLRRETMRLRVLMMVCTTLFLASASLADTGFFVGGGGLIQMVPGSGSWNDVSFKVREPLSTGEDGAVGFFWADNFLLGVRPLIGYRISDSLAFQATYSLSIPKTSIQSYSESNNTTYYSQSLTVDWSQGTTELLAVYSPDADLDYFVYGGLDLTRVSVDVTLTESAGAGDQFGNEFFNGDFQVISDDIDALGLVVGAGILVPSFGRHTEGFLSLQYSTAKTGDTLFGTQNFNVTVGGFALQAGVRWFPFASDE
jgi:hypothetical protein